MLVGKEIRKKVDRSVEILGDGWITNPEYESNLKGACSGKWVHVPAECKRITDDMLAEIRRAKEIVCVSSFIIQDTKILDALSEVAANGVRVYILTAAEEQLKEPDEFLDEDHYLERRERREDYKILLNSLSKFTLIRTGGMLHSKLILIDPDTEPRGYLLTSNLTQRAFEENKELILSLNEERVCLLFNQFTAGFLSLADKQLLERNKKGFTLSPVKSEQLPEDLKISPMLFQVGKKGNISSEILSLISSAEESIDISAWKFVDDHPVSDKIIEKLKQGVKVRIFTRQSADNIAFLKRAVSEGALVYSHWLMHAKSLVVDGKRGAVFTANIDKRGLDEGFETGCILNNEEVRELHNLHELWCRQCDLIFKNNVTTKEATKGFETWVSRKEVKFEIESETKVVNHGIIRAPIMSDYLLDDWFPHFKLDSPTSLSEEHIWIKEPPRIKKGLTEYKSDGKGEKTDLRIYREGNKKFYIVIESERDYQKALKVAKNLKADIVAQ